MLKKTLLLGHFCSLLLFLVIAEHTEINQRCDLPETNTTISMSPNKLPLNLRITGTYGDKSIAAGSIAYFDFEQIRGRPTKISAFVFWVEENNGNRVGTWTCCYEAEPFFQIEQGCPGGNASTIASVFPLSASGFYVHDIRFMWRASENTIPALTFKGVLVALENGKDQVGYQVSVGLTGHPKLRRIPPESFNSVSQKFKRDITESSETSETEGKGSPPPPTSPPPTSPPPTSPPPPTSGGSGSPTSTPTGSGTDCGDRNGFPASPVLLTPFTRPFREPPTAVPDIQATCDAEGRCFVYYEITAVVTPVQFFPTGPATLFFTYGQNSTGIFTSPGPTIKNCQGQQTIVRYRNLIRNANGTARTTSVHLHGSGSFAPFDGWADDVTSSTQTKDYVYPNNRPATLWYHDHAFSITSDNAYAGLYSQYWVEPCCFDYTGTLPIAPYDFPFILIDAVFDTNNQLRYDKTGVHKDSLYGDHILVNGVAWPLLSVEPRKYRFRMLVSNPSRPYQFRFSNNMTFWVIAADGGLLQQPRPVTSYFHAIAERWEIVVDFSKLKGQEVYMMNDDDLAPQFCQTHLVAKFVVNKTLSAIPDVTWTPTTFPTIGLLPGGAPPLEFVVPQKVRDAAVKLPNADRIATFVRNGGEFAIDVTPVIANVLNTLGNIGPLTWGETFKLAQPHVVMNPNVNSFELWEFANGGGGWFHPIHTHLIDALILARTTTFPTYEVQSPKDVFFLPPGGKLRIVSRLGPHAGSYMIHCHNLVHEDNDMLLAFGTQDDVNVTGKKLFQDGQFLHIPQSPVVNFTDFQNSLRNPMYQPTRAVNLPVLNGPQTVARQLQLNVYNVMYPNFTDPIRLNATGQFPPLGNNSFNPWEVDYKCWRQPPKKFVQVTVPKVAPAPPPANF